MQIEEVLLFNKKQLSIPKRAAAAFAATDLDSQLSFASDSAILVKESLARNASLLLPAQLLLAESNVSMLRSVLAESACLDETVQLKLVLDTFERTRSSLAKNAFLSRSVFDFFVYNEHSSDILRLLLSNHPVFAASADVHMLPLPLVKEFCAVSLKAELAALTVKPNMVNTVFLDALFPSWEGSFSALVETCSLMK